jgi:hypothetical protein
LPTARLAWLNKGPTPDNVAQARSFFDRALAADPDNVDALRLGGREVFCPPSDLAGKQIMSAFERFVDDNPDLADPALWHCHGGVPQPRVPLCGKELIPVGDRAVIRTGAAMMLR